MNTITHKINQAIRLLRSVCRDEVVEVCYSGGKDSDVILELAKMAGIKYRAIYRSTTIDPPGTISYVQSRGVEIHRPSRTFFEKIKSNGFPTMRARFCCATLKEYKILDIAIQGIRRCESVKRKKRYSEYEPVICRVYGAKANHVSVVLPILTWTDNDVETFINERGLRIHPLYYDKDGRLRVERRLGCIGCPMKSDRGLSDFKQHPKLVKAWISAGKEWMATHPNVASHKKFGNIYDLFYHNIFCKSYAEYLDSQRLDLFGQKLDCKLFIENYFNIRL